MISLAGRLPSMEGGEYSCCSQYARRDVSKPPPVVQANRQWAIRWGRRKALTMSRRTRGFPPTRPLARRIAYAISMGHYQRDLV